MWMILKKMNKWGQNCRDCSGMMDMIALGDEGEF